MMGGPVRLFLLALLTGAVVMVDQLTKVEVMQSMQLHQSIPIIPGYFNLTYIRNPGAAFGFMAGAGSGVRVIFFAITSLFALGVLCMILMRLPESDWLGQYSIAAILGGAIGNLLDRVRYGEVIDFLDVYVGTYHWPAFNVADAAITVGVVFLIIHFSREKPAAVETPPTADALPPIEPKPESGQPSH
ncbi:MAG: signal peptidase II [Nitrospiraceae bacterium]